MMIGLCRAQPTAPNESKPLLALNEHLECLSLHRFESEPFRHAKRIGVYGRVATTPDAFDFCACGMRPSLLGEIAAAIASRARHLSREHAQCGGELVDAVGGRLIQSWLNLPGTCSSELCLLPQKGRQILRILIHG